MIGRARVFGPAYLDRVVRVDRPLLANPAAPPLDQSVNGRIRADKAEGLKLIDPSGAAIEIETPEGWLGPLGIVDLDQEVFGPSPETRRVGSSSWLDDLGGMGAGLASALGATLVSALGPTDDLMSRSIASMLDKHGIAREGPRVDDRPADWTLLITSGEHGDKLAVGFRGCHAALGAGAFDPYLTEPHNCRVVAGLPNRIAAEVLRAPGARLRVFAPALRNMIDRDPPILEMAEYVDILCCNRLEWESLEDREEVAARISILIVTEGASGSFARYNEPWGASRRVRVPAFPRSRPPRDTNRAGEAFASWLVASLVGSGWDPSSGVVDDATMRAALTRASAAAALVLDREEFGFPTDGEVDEAIRLGIVA